MPNNLLTLDCQTHAIMSDHIPEWLALGSAGRQKGVHQACTEVGLGSLPLQFVLDKKKFLAFRLPLQAKALLAQSLRAGASLC